MGHGHGGEHRDDRYEEEGEGAGAHSALPVAAGNGGAEERCESGQAERQRDDDGGLDGQVWIRTGHRVEARRACRPERRFVQHR